MGRFNDRATGRTESTVRSAPKRKKRCDEAFSGVNRPVRRPGRPRLRNDWGWSRCSAPEAVRERSLRTAPDRSSARWSGFPNPLVPSLAHPGGLGNPPHTINDAGIGIAPRARSTPTFYRPRIRGGLPRVCERMRTCSRGPRPDGAEIDKTGDHSRGGKRPWLWTSTPPE